MIYTPISDSISVRVVLYDRCTLSECSIKLLRSNILVSHSLRSRKYHALSVVATSSTYKLSSSFPGLSFLVYIYPCISKHTSLFSSPLFHIPRVPQEATAWRICYCRAQYFRPKGSLGHKKQPEHQASRLSLIEF